MDVNTLMKLVLSPESTNQISAMTGISTDQITGVLNSIIPSLLSGASEQANNAETADSFAKALELHGEKDTKDLSSFLGGVDLSDGAKIVAHLLGANAGTTANTAAKSSGLSATDVKKIMTIVAPLLLSILGQQKKKHGVSGSALLSLLMAGTGSQATSAASILSLLGMLMK